jgi:hypothetical protein
MLKIRRKRRRRRKKKRKRKGLELWMTRGTIIIIRTL